MSLGTKVVEKPYLAFIYLQSATVLYVFARL